MGKKERREHKNSRVKSETKPHRYVGADPPTTYAFKRVAAMISLAFISPS